MKLMHMTKKKMVALGLTFGIALGAGGIAAAYLSASGSGTGTATVGSASELVVTGGSVTTLLPNGVPKTATFVVSNPNSFSVHFSGATATLTETPSSTCDISISGPSVTSGTIPAGGTTSITVTVTMTTNPTYTQGSCSGKVHLSV